MFDKLHWEENFRHTKLVRIWGKSQPFTNLKCIVQVICGSIPMISITFLGKCALATHPSHKMNHQTVAAEHPSCFNQWNSKQAFTVFHPSATYVTLWDAQLTFLGVWNTQWWVCVLGIVMADTSKISWWFVLYTGSSCQKMCSLKVFWCEPHMFRMWSEPPTWSAS